MSQTLTDDQKSELEIRYLYSCARIVDGMSFEDYKLTAQPYEDDTDEEQSVETDRESHEAYMKRRMREEENQLMGKKNYVDEMQRFMDGVDAEYRETTFGPLNEDDTAIDDYFDYIDDENDPILKREREALSGDDRTLSEILNAAIGEPADPEAVQRADQVEMYVSGNHYNDVVPGMQYMEMMQYMLEGKTGVEAHLLGQIYKYLMRAGKKDDYEQDLRKASWYCNCLAKYINTGTVSADDNDIIVLMSELNESRS
jgi:hypothetical protein